MDTGLQTAIAVGLFSLAGAVIGAAASTIGPWILQRHQRKVEKEERRISARGEAVGSLVNAWVAFAAMRPPSDPERASTAFKESVVAANHAMTQMLLTLPKSEQAVASYVAGVMRTIAREPKSVETRMGVANHAGQELVDWHRGVVNIKELLPFEFVGYGPRAQLLIRRVDGW